MKAYLTDSPGGWEATRIVDLPLPPGRDDQALVAIRAVGLNPADAFQIEGRYPGGPKPPFIAGRDAAGVVVQGDKTGRWYPGQSVLLLQSAASDLKNGTLIERQWITAECLTELPAGWSFAEAAAGPLVYLTAWMSLTRPVPVEAGQVVLVTGASGGVGLASVHLAVACGATVVALSRSAVKRQRLLEQGAHFAFAPDAEGLKEQINAATGRKGVDVVVENVGGAQLTSAIHLLGVHGRVSMVGVLAGVEASLPIPAVMFKRASLHGILVSDYSPADSRSHWNQIVELLNRSGRRPIVDRIFPFVETRAAFEHLRSDVFGKVVVEVSK